jgi:hypothetical protein
MTKTLWLRLSIFIPTINTEAKKHIRTVEDIIKNCLNICKNIQLETGELSHSPLQKGFKIIMIRLMMLKKFCLYLIRLQESKKRSQLKLTFKS